MESAEQDKEMTIQEEDLYAFVGLEVDVWVADDPTTASGKLLYMNTGGLGFFMCGNLQFDKWCTESIDTELRLIVVSNAYDTNLCDWIL